MASCWPGSARSFRRHRDHCDGDRDDPEGGAPAEEPARLAEPVRGPLREAQRRCQQLGQSAASDADCMRVSAETRDRFLGRAPAPTAPPQNQGQ